MGRRISGQLRIFRTICRDSSKFSVKNPFVFWLYKLDHCQEYHFWLSSKPVENKIYEFWVCCCYLYCFSQGFQFLKCLCVVSIKLLLAPGQSNACTMGPYAYQWGNGSDGGECGNSLDLAGERSCWCPALFWVRREGVLLKAAANLVVGYF